MAEEQELKKLPLTGAINEIPVDSVLPAEPKATPVTEQLDLGPVTPDNSYQLDPQEWEKRIAKGRQEAAQSAPPAPEVQTTQPVPEPTQPTTDKPTADKSAKTEPTAEELASRRREIAEKHNFSSVLLTDNGTDEELEEAKELTKPKVKSEDTLSRYEVVEQLGMRTMQQRSLQTALDYLHSIDEKLTALPQELGVGKVKLNVKRTDSPVKLSGKRAVTAVLARTRGVYKVQLYNSGFWISIKPITMGLMDTWMESIDREFKELGKIIGGQSQMVLDVFIKQKFMELLPDSIVESNLIDWQDPEVLNEAISFNDYETLMWAFSSIMYKDGIGIGVHCTNPDCLYRDDTQYVDLMHGLQINDKVLNPKAMKWLLEGNNNSVSRSLDEVKRYQNELISRDVVLKFPEQGMNLHLTTPSMAKYLTYGTSLIADLAATIHGELNYRNSNVYKQLAFNLYRMLAPWVSQIELLDDDGQTNSLLEDVNDIAQSLDYAFGNEVRLYERINEFIGKSRAVYFGSTMLECPKCHKRPNFAEDHFVPWDMEHVFFGLCYQLLDQIARD